MTELRTGPAAATPRPTEPARRASRRTPAPRTVLAVASLGVLVAFLDITIVNIAFPDIARSFAGTSIAELSWVLSAYNIVFAAFLVPAGRVADVIGRRRTFVAGLWVFTAASALCAVAPSPGTLIAARVLQALGAAALVPASLSIVLDAFPVERRRHAVALWTAVAALAAGIGPTLGGLLVSVASWRLVFLVNLPVGLAAILLVRRHIVESRAPGRRRVPDLPGALLLALAVGLLVLGITQSEPWGAGDTRTLASFAGALVLGAAFVRRSAVHRDPIVDLELLRIPAFALANGFGIVAAAGFFGYTLANVLFLTAIWGYSALEAGLALTPGPFIAAAVAGPTSRLVERVGHRPVLLAGGLVWGAGVLWLITQVGPRPAFASEWLPGMVILGVGAGTLFANLSATAVAAAPGERFGTATGLHSVARQLGAALGVAIAIAILGTPRSVAEGLAAFDDVWTFAALCLAGAGVGCLTIGRLASGEPPSLAEASRAVRAPRREPPAPSPAALLGTPATSAPPAPPPQESVADFLAAAPLLGGLAPAQREALAARAVALRLPLGDWLFRAGDPGDAMYIVRAGRLEVVGPEPNTPVLRVLGRGDAVGELALLADAPRSASVRAARDCELVAVERADFDRVLQDQPAAAVAIARTLAGQLRDSRGAPAGKRPLPSTVAVVALDDGVPIARLAAGLERALGRLTRIRRLDGAETDPDGDGVARFGPLLDRAEAEHDQVLLVGGDARRPDPWTAFCLQQADRVLAVASGAVDPGAARADLRGCELVAYDIRPGSGALTALAEALDPAGTHAWRPGPTLDADLARTARRLTGRAVGVVLSGGGARAFSHLGVLEELSAAGVVVDRVSGVSMGAMVGGMAATGMDADEIDATLYEEWVRGRPLSDYTAPRHALIRGERFEAMLRRVFGAVAIEELACGFTCASADLRRSELVMHRHGRLGDHVATSMCIPILAPPQVRGRRLLVDGSLIDNLPVAPMAATGEGPIIAVDVKAGVERDRDGAGPQAPPRGGRQRVAGGGPPPPRLGETVVRVLLLATSNTTEAARRDADLLIAPRDPGIGLLEFHQLDRAREAGRAAARAALDGAAPDVIARLTPP